jgi:pyruvate formate lyase activating enzyme
VLDQVTGTVRMLKERGFWVEIVTLIVPGFSDDIEDLCRMAGFIASVDPLMPWHVTAFHPDYQFGVSEGFRATTADELMRVVEVGVSAGLKYVYPGNLPGAVGAWEDTRCHACGVTLIRRRGFVVLENRVGADGTCPECRAAVPGVWSSEPR